MADDPHVWIDIVCDRCARRFPTKVFRSWLDKAAVIPARHLCAKCAAVVRRQESKEFDQRHQLRFRFDEGETGGQSR